MEVVHGKDMAWSEQEERHRVSSLGFKTLFKGAEDDPNNFRWVLSRNDGEYSSPHHKHSFDQIRFCVQGSANIAPGKTLYEGDVGFFPEGTAYGPQKDADGGRITLVFQGGGASGLGYMSSVQLRRGLEELEKLGTFRGGRYCFHGQSDSASRDSYEAIWEHIFGRSLKYPPQRYDEAILMRTASFAWIPDAESTGVSRRRLGTFTERQTRLEMIRLDQGAKLKLGETGAMVLAFTVNGSGHGTAGIWREHTAFRIESGETVELESAELTELHVIVLPTLRPRSGTN